MDFPEMKGMTIRSIELEGSHGTVAILFSMKNGRVFKLYHEQDCCEFVKVEEIHGDINDLIGNPLLECEEVPITNRYRYCWI